MKKKKKKNLTHISEILGKSLGSGFLNFTAQKLRVFELWPQIVGPIICEQTKAYELYNGKLIVLVEGPMWLERFNYEKRKWLKDLNAELIGLEVVDEIILKVGQWR